MGAVDGASAAGGILEDSFALTEKEEGLLILLRLDVGDSFGIERLYFLMQFCWMSRQVQS